MSQFKVKGRPRADKRNVLNLFGKRYKSAVPTSNATACCSACSHADRPGTLRSNVPVKEKRLKTRKERDYRKQRFGGQKIKSHCHSKQSCRERELCQEHCQPQSHSLNREFAKAFGPKELSFITERRLIGHQGLFNHEVKSFDIERLLSEERRVERSKMQGHDTNKITFSPTPSPAQNSDDDKKCPPTHKDEVSRTCSRQEAFPETECVDMVRSQTCLQSADSSANNHGSGPSLYQRKTEDMYLSPSESNSVIALSSSPKSTVSNNNPSNSVEEFNSPKVHCADTIQPMASNVNIQNSEYTAASLKPPAPYPKMQKPSSTPNSPLVKDVSSASLDQMAKSGTERAQTEAKIARHLISVVANRLCQSLDRPLVLRHHLVAESRATLLHMLQERHGVLLQRNLQKLHTTFGFGQSQLDSRLCADIPGEDKWTAVNSVQGSGSKPDPVLQSWLGSQQKPFYKRRRKQRHPQRRTLPSPPSTNGHLNGSLQDTDLRKSQCSPWTLNMGTEQEVLMEPANPTSDLFSLGLQTTDTFLTDGNIFSSKWGSLPGLPQSWDKPHHQEEIHTQSISSSCDHWKHDPDLHFTCQIGNIGQHKHSFSSYRIMPQEGDLREPLCLSVDQQFDFERHLVTACSPDTKHSSLRNFQLQPYYRFHYPVASTSSFMTSYRPDMNLYPPSELLDMALSPPKCPSASPEGWSYPRMRLY